MTTRFMRSIALLVLAVFFAGCAASQAIRRGNAAVRAGNLDEAVVQYRKAVLADPENANYKIALERAMLAASRSHLDRAREFEQNDQLEAALGEYKQAAEYDPSNRQAVSKVAELERTIRDRIEASRPKPPIQELRERARAASAEPVLNPASREPLRLNFPNTPLRDILNFIANLTGINITFDRDVQDRLVTINLDGVTLEQALNQIMTMNQLSYKVVSERSIFVFPDTGPKHAIYDEQVVRTFYVSHADATELVQTLGTIMRMPGMAVVPAIIANKTANSITVRATAAVVQIIEKIIQQNDKPRAEIVVDVEILEVDRSRTKAYGINLSDYSLGTIFSPETSPNGTTVTTPSTPTGGTPTTPTAPGGTSTPPGAVRSPAPFNLNTISRGVSTADFYLAVPTAIVNFLESDTHTRIIAKPQIRGAEGSKFTLKLGDKVPVISTSYTPIATGGAGVNPLSSYQYQDVGVNLDITPRVTLEGDILMDLTVEDTSRKADVVIAGVNIPSFGQRTVTTRLRLRDGESNLLAGLLQENSSDSIKGFPGAIHVPVLKQLFSGNNKTVDQTDIVMLLTPHIIRTHEITEDDLKPLFIGSQQNLGVGGPPPLIAPPPLEPQPAPAAAAPGMQPGFATTTPPGEIVSSPNPQRGPGGTVVAPPPGTSPVPGTVLVTPPAPTTPPATVVPVPPPETTPPPPAQPAAPPTPPPAAAPPAAAPPSPTTTQGIGSAQVTVSPPPAMRVGGGPYTVPISIADATRISTVTLTLIYDPTKLRVRTVQEGSFMRAGGATVAFSQQVTGNRIDITLARGADSTGASGTGLLAAILFDAIAYGSSTLTLSGAATGPGGVAMGLRFTPVTVVVQ
jgi:general secretion pathway protein D